MSQVAGGTALDRVAVALDTADWPTFRVWCELFGPRVGALKVGSEAYLRWGPAAVAEARRGCQAVFLDVKLHDIPNTMSGAVSAARDLGVRYLTVHAAAGPAALAAASAAAGPELRLLAVTVLTHLGTADLGALGLPGSAGERALRWARLAHDAGCAGVVCSALEAEELRQAHPRPFLLVTPGIRPAMAGGAGAGDDQRRTALPSVALAAGADLLVIGRPLTRAAEPAAALDELAAELAGGPSAPA